MSLNHIYLGSTAATIPIQARSITIPTLPNGLDIITGPSGVIAAAYPTTISIPFTNSITTRILANGCPVGETTLFTVPSGYQAIFVILLYNPTGGAITSTVYTRIGGTTYFVQSPGSVSSNSSSSFSAVYTYQPGESCIIDFSLEGMNIAGNAIMWPITSAAFTSIAYKGLTAASQVVYTVPAGKVAYPTGSWPTYPALQGNGRVGQNSGTSSAFPISIVSGGETVTVYNTSLTGSGSSGGPAAWDYPLVEGDQIVVAVSSAGARSASSHFWLNILLLDASTVTVNTNVVAVPAPVPAAIPVPVPATISMVSTATPEYTIESIDERKEGEPPHYTEVL